MLKYGIQHIKTTLWLSIIMLIMYNTPKLKIFTKMLFKTVKIHLLATVQHIFLIENTLLHTNSPQPNFSNVPVNLF